MRAVTKLFIARTIPRGVGLLNIAFIKVVMLPPIQDRASVVEPQKIPELIVVVIWFSKVLTHSRIPGLLGMPALKMMQLVAVETAVRIGLANSIKAELLQVVQLGLIVPLHVLATQVRLALRLQLHTVASGL